jgi:broad specificity phosphatase PhoE
VLEAIQAIADAHPGENVLVVAHGGALNVLWHHAIGERVERWANCAVYKLAVREDGYVPVD